jgi:hypothetical protein
MPCYDPPPPWAAAKNKNANDAVRLLCREVSMLIRSTAVVPKDMLIWFLEHREIDRQIATTDYYGSDDSAEAQRTESDIELVKQLLGKS